MSYRLHIDGVELHIESSATDEEELACREMVQERLDEWCAEMNEALDELWSAQVRDRASREALEAPKADLRMRLSTEQLEFAKEALESVTGCERLHLPLPPESLAFLRGELSLDPEAPRCCSNEKPHVPGGIWCRREEER